MGIDHIGADLSDRPEVNVKSHGKGPSVLATQTVELRHPCWPQLEAYASEFGIDLAEAAEALANDRPDDFLVWGPGRDGLFVYFNEREYEVGVGAEQWVRAYAARGEKPSGYQYEDEGVGWDVPIPGDPAMRTRRVKWEGGKIIDPLGA